jgi:hypothetical protein
VKLRRWLGFALLVAPLVAFSAFKGTWVPVLAIVSVLGVIVWGAMVTWLLLGDFEAPRPPL